MAETTTLYYNLTKPSVGESTDSWGTTLNANLDKIANAIHVAETADPSLKKAQNLADLPNKATARANLQLEVGEQVQAHSDVLDAFANASFSESTFAYATGAANFAVSPITAEARAFLSAASSATRLSALATAIGLTLQAHDGELDDLAGLAAGEEDVIQRRGGAWTARSIADLKGDLDLTAADVDLALVDNTPDAEKPVSGPQANAIANAVSAHAGLANPHSVYLLSATAAIDYQGKNLELTRISAMTVENDQVMQRKGDQWEGRTPAQLKADMGLASVQDLSADEVLLTMMRSHVFKALGDKTPVRVNGGTDPNSGLISWGTGDPGALAVGEIYLKHEA